MNLARMVREPPASADIALDLRTTAVALAIALLALNVLDMSVTMFNIEHLGAVELNLLMAPLLGTPLAYALKFGIPFAIIALAARVTSQRFLMILRAAVAVYLVVVIIGMGQVAYALAIIA